MTDMANSENGRESLRTLLRQDHQELERTFQALLDALRADARNDVLKFWAAFDDGLCQHMALEEQHVLPALREQDAREADALSKEHDEIRMKLAELGPGVDLHEIRAETVSDFVEQLRRHANREDALAYRWAEHHLPSSERAILRTRLGTARFLRQRLTELGRTARARLAAVRPL
jgi:hemerythrin-like domain-containing protein